MYDGEMNASDTSTRVAHNCLPLSIVGARETHSMIRADPTPSEPTFPSLRD